MPHQMAFEEVVQQLERCRVGRCEHQDKPRDCIAFDDACSTNHRAAITLPFDDEYDDEKGGCWP